MSFSLQCFCYSAIPTSNLSAPGVTIPAAVAVPQKGPYELLCLLVWEGVGTSLPNASMAQRYVLTHFSPCSLIYEPHSKDSWEKDPHFHLYSLLHNTQIRRPVCSLREARNHSKKIVSRTQSSYTSKKTPSPPIYIGDFKTATSAFAVTLAVMEEPVLCFQT